MTLAMEASQQPRNPDSGESLGSLMEFDGSRENNY